MHVDAVNPGNPSPPKRPARGKEMSARIGIGLLFVVLTGCMAFVGWSVFTRF